MYSVINTSGFQFKVNAGQILRLPLMQAEPGTTVTFEQVLLANDGAATQVGQPVVAGAKVSAEVLLHGKTNKVMVFRRKRRKGFRRLRGHRQDFTEVVITGLSAGSQNAAAEATRLEFARKRAAAWATRHTPSAPAITRAEKIAQGLPKPAKVKKNELRKQKQEA
ncbi:MAG: 50S ribosomal protein L21 [Fibrobacterota bacterium]|mgnify:FL=1